MNNKPYAELKAEQLQKKLRALLREMPGFVREYDEKMSRSLRLGTRYTYLLDIRAFLSYILRTDETYSKFTLIKDLPVYAVTADIEEQKKFEEHGFTGILLKPVTIEKLSRLLIRKASTDDKDKEADEILNAVLTDTKLACKTAAIYLLDGYWKLKFRYWYLWRWFYYIRQYSNDQLQDILVEGKKKVPLTQFLTLTMSLTEARVTLMMMRTEEAERILQGLASEHRQETEKQGNG